jgi:hypothetical protein
MAILNKYVVCPVPADDDPVWALVVSGDNLTYSLDGGRVILKWPGSEMPPEAECARLNGTCYNSTEVLVVLAGADWKPAEAVVGGK